MTRKTFDKWVLPNDLRKISVISNNLLLRLKSRTVECPVVNGDQFQYQGMITPRMSEILLDFGCCLRAPAKNRLVGGGDGVFVREFSSLQTARRDANEIPPVILVSTAPWYEG